MCLNQYEALDYQLENQFDIPIVLSNTIEVNANGISKSAAKAHVYRIK